MNKFKSLLLLILGAMLLMSCAKKDRADSDSEGNRKYFLEKVRNVLVVQVYADEFEGLSLKQKTLAWHLYRSAIAGRDIYYDQSHKHALKIRNILEAVIENPEGLDQEVYENILEYTKMFWINTGQ